MCAKPRAPPPDSTRPMRGRVALAASRGARPVTSSAAPAVPHSNASAQLARIRVVQRITACSVVRSVY